ncbi:hypothetical protein C8J56DRAFT_1061933 [Mycena floridula]|nr:hypothetical protein C8J56DRAFT_1061933 [Mycena floridula]
MVPSRERFQPHLPIAPNSELIRDTIRTPFVEDIPTTEVFVQRNRTFQGLQSSLVSVPARILLHYIIFVPVVLLQHLLHRMVH